MSVTAKKLRIGGPTASLATTVVPSRDSSMSLVVMLSGVRSVVGSSSFVSAMIDRGPNERSRVDAGVAFLFAFLRAQPGATHRERSAAERI